jgi:hypothetical protein
MRYDRSFAFKLSPAGKPPEEILKTGAAEKMLPHPPMLVNTWLYGMPTIAFGNAVFTIDREFEGWLPGARTLNVSTWALEDPAASVTVRGIEYVPAVNGIPEMPPVVGFIVSPAGKATDDDQRYGGVPPLAANDAVNAEPATAERLEGLTIIRACAPGVDPAWVMFTVCPATVMVPLRAAPVFASTRNASPPEPVPFAPEAIEIQLALLTAVHGQSPAVFTEIVPIPGPTGNCIDCVLTE